MFKRLKMLILWVNCVYDRFKRTKIYVRILHGKMYKISKV